MMWEARGSGKSHAGRADLFSLPDGTPAGLATQTPSFHSSSIPKEAWEVGDGPGEVVCPSCLCLPQELFTIHQEGWATGGRVGDT